MVLQPDLYKFPEARVLIFAKAPILNQVKTRLISDLGAQKATRLYQLMLHQTVATAVNSHLCNVQLCCMPDTQHEDFLELRSRYSVELVTQQGANLGERMFFAASKALKISNSVLIIGTDCLQMAEFQLGQALSLLQSKSYDVVVTPAHDGGYVLLGLNRVSPELFEGIEWGTDRVMDQTRSALDGLGWKWHESTLLRDVDTIDDIQHIYNNEHQYLLDTGVRELVQSIFS